MEVVILIGEIKVRSAVGDLAAVLRQSGRADGTVRRRQAMLDLFAAFLAARGVEVPDDEACLDFIAKQTGVRLGALGVAGICQGQECRGGPPAGGVDS